MREPAHTATAAEAAGGEPSGLGGELNFEELVATLETPLLRYAAHLLGAGTGEAAEDLVQEAFLRLHRQILKKGTGSVADPRVWLFRVLYNLAIDAIRKRARHRRGREVVVRRAQEQAPETTDVIQEMVRREACDKAMAEVNRLPAKLRRVVMLKVISAMTMKQIAQATSTSPSNVCYRLHQALSTVARKLREGEVL